MATLLRAVAALALAGPAWARAPFPTEPAPLLPGDLLVATDRAGPQAGTTILRFRDEAAPGQGLGAAPILALPGEVEALVASDDGRWLAVERVDGPRGPRVDLFDFSTLVTARDPIWSSPLGCAAPTLDAGRLLVMRCPGSDRAPPHLLRLDLESWHTLLLGGEWARATPRFGPGGDLFWTEERPHGTVIVRQPVGHPPFVTHELTDPVRSLWPQADGSLLAELSIPGSRREVQRCLPSGATQLESLAGSQSDAAGGLWMASHDGTHHWMRCEPHGCSVSGILEGGVPIAFALPPDARTMAAVPPLRGPERPAEDLATAPGDALDDLAATDVSVLGLGLGSPLETAWSVLDRAERHPYWLPARAPRGRPGGIGIGPAAAGHCIEYLADDRGTVQMIRLRGCASHWVSPSLRAALSETATPAALLDAAQRLLGPTVSVRFEGEGADGRGAPAQGIRRIHLALEAADRGLRYHASSDVFVSSPSTAIDGRIVLELSAPARGQAARP